MENMGTVIIVVALVIIAVIAIKSYARKLSSGCCGAVGDSEKKIKVDDKDPAHYPYTVKIGVSGMTCRHCMERVENALNSENSVWAEVDLNSSVATVRMKSLIPEEVLRGRIIAAGYGVVSFEKQNAD